MSNVSILSNAVAVSNGKVTTTSLKIAEVFGKLHKDVLKVIESLQVPDNWHKRNFALMQIDRKIGNGAIRKDKAYSITRDGFTLLVMGFTGKAAMQFKIAYLEEFNRMEAELRRMQAGVPSVPSVSVRKSPCPPPVQPEPYFVPEATYFNVPVMSTRALAKLLGVPKYRIYNARANCRVKLAAGIDFFPVRTHQELRTGGCASVFGNLIGNIDLFMESGAKKVSDYLRYGITTPPMLRSPWLPPPKPAQPEKTVQPPALNLPRRASGVIRQEYGYRLDDAFFEDDTVERALRELYKAGYDVGPALAKAEFMRAALRRVRSVHQIFGDVLKIESSHSITTAGTCSGWVGRPPAR